MANPNILTVSTITGKTYPFLIGTNPVIAASNDSTSNYLFKINSLFVANTDGQNTADVTVDFYRAGLAFKIVSTISVKADSSLVVLGKDTSIYLEPGDAIRCYSTSSGMLTGVISYEILE